MFQNEKIVTYLNDFYMDCIESSLILLLVYSYDFRSHIEHGNISHTNHMQGWLLIMFLLRVVGGS